MVIATDVEPFDGELAISNHIGQTPLRGSPGKSTKGAHDDGLMPGSLV
ncbi:hypothetical protein L842_5970 [Mycobacterium intracellulare MIN_052511_1280]|nr:hypothetical protein L842_5970 [Mycobacterium intracellulare MIN_052511_1280]